MGETVLILSSLNKNCGSEKIDNNLNVVNKQNSKNTTITNDKKKQTVK